MTVCFFGSYNPNYSRNKILIDGLKKNSVIVLHCRSTQESIIKRYPELFRQFWSVKNKVDVIYVAFVGHLDMPLAWLLARLTGKKLVFDMFYSMFDTYVFDRQSATPTSFRGRTYWWIDKIAATLADLVITDTNAHARYFIRTFRLNAKKFRRVFVGGDDTLFKKIKQKKSSNKIIIEFHGMFTRLHGAEYFVKAAKAMENYPQLEFWLIGSTSNYPLPIELYKELDPKNMRYFPELIVDALAKKISSATISVGHVGGTEKARSVITNKMFHAINCGLTVIAGDCPASYELFTNETAVFVKMGESQDLVKKLREVIKNGRLRSKLVANGYKLAADLTNQKIAAQLLNHIDEAFGFRNV